MMCECLKERESVGKEESNNFYFLILFFLNMLLKMKMFAEKIKHHQSFTR